MWPGLVGMGSPGAEPLIDLDTMLDMTAKELTVEPGTKATITDNGAYSLICVQGSGKINGQPLVSPSSSASTN